MIDIIYNIPIYVYILGLILFSILIYYVLLKLETRKWLKVLYKYYLLQKEYNKTTNKLKKNFNILIISII